jgi:hypothetical protein
LLIVHIFTWVGCIAWRVVTSVYVFRLYKIYFRYAVTLPDEDIKDELKGSKGPFLLLTYFNKTEYDFKRMEEKYLKKIDSKIEKYGKHSL